MHFGFSEPESHISVQVGLKLMPMPCVSLSAGITAVRHHTQPKSHLFMWRFLEKFKVFGYKQPKIKNVM